MTATGGAARGSAPGLAVLVGLQASGKSTFVAQAFPADHVRVSKDRFPRARNRQRRQMRRVAEALRESRSVVVDNTNPTPRAWAPLIALGRALGARVVAYWFPPDLPASLRRNTARHGRERVPAVGVYATARSLRRPSRADGFDAVYEVRLDGRGGFTVRLVEPSPGA